MACLEEAKLCDLTEWTSATHAARKLFSSSLAHTATTGVNTGNDDSSEQLRSGPRCYHCQGQGHIAKNCPVKGCVMPVVSRGHGGGSFR